MNYFSSASSTVNYFLLSGNVDMLSDVHFSPETKLNNDYLLSLSRKFNSISNKFKLKDVPPHANLKVTIGPNLWHETNYFYKDAKSKKMVQVMQVVVLFEGNDAEKEKKEPKIKDVVLRTGKAIISRQAFLTDQKPIEPPPPMQ